MYMKHPKKYLQVKPQTANTFNNGGIYTLNCKDCPLAKQIACPRSDTKNTYWQ